MNGNFWAGLAGGIGTGMTLGQKLADLQMKNEISDVPGESSTPVVSGADANAAGMDAYQRAMDAANSPEEKAAIQQQYKPTLDALSANQSSPAAMAYSLGTGKSFRQQSSQFSGDDVAAQQALDRAMIYRKSGRPDLAREEQLAESSRRQLADDASTRAASQGGDGTVDGYISKIAPRVVANYLAQGDVKSASALAGFIDSQEGQTYAKNWGVAMRKVAIGDYDGAIPHLEKLYDAMSDGNTAKATNLGNGKYRIDLINSNSGDVVRSQTMSAKDLAHNAIMALAPEKLVEFQAKFNEQRSREASTLDRQTQLEQLRQDGQEAREDRRDARLEMRLDAMAQRGGVGGLTVPQQRTNDAIDAARKQIAGLSQEEILKRTQATTATGRPNDLYDPQLSRSVKLAHERKYGADEDHDAMTQQTVQRNAGQMAREDIAKKFRADSTMSGNTLGRVTPKGVEVLKNGKLIGYYQ